MKLFDFIISLIFSNFLIQSGNATKYDALAIQQVENELRIVAAATDVEGLFFQYVSAYGSNILYYMCRAGSTNTLKIETTVKNNYGDQKKICSNPVEPTILQVTGEFKNDEGKEDINLYDIGFKVNDSKFKSVVETTRYDSIEKGDYFIPMISVYRDKKLQHTIAVRYEILTTDIRKKLDENFVETYQMSPFFDRKVEQLFSNQKSKLTEIIGTNYNETNHILVLDSLVNENDFIIDTWKKTTRYKVHEILIWKANFQMWRNVREIVREIASVANSRKNIYAGIGKALTITGSDKNQYKLEWNQGGNTIFIPELYWTAVEFTKITGRNGKTTGLVVIMHNEPPNVLESNVEKICDTDLCRSNGIWNIKEGAEKIEGRVYCCPLDSETISKLGAKFLLNERSFFNAWIGMNFPPKWE